MENLTDLYTDYLISSPDGSTTAVGMSRMLDGKLSHDQITHFLSKGNYDSKYLWQQVKSMVQELTNSKEEIVLSFDDSIEEKYYSDQSELICWHFDHVFKRSVKGVNFLTALVNIAGVRLPCAVEFVKKDKWVTDEKTGKQKRQSTKTKNELYREMLLRCDTNFRFDYVANDSWFSSVENMKFVQEELHVNFVMALKANGKVALSLENKKAKNYINPWITLAQHPNELPGNFPAQPD